MMAANNYFGFTHGGTQYGAATAGAAYGTQTGYAVAPAATAATYGTQRAAATGYDTAYQAAAATQAAHAQAHAHAAAAAASAYDASKTAYYQQAAAAYPAAAAAPPQPAYEPAPAKPAYSQTYAQNIACVQGAGRATAKPYAYGAAYPAQTATYAAQTQQAKPAAARAGSAYDTALYNAATMYVAQQSKAGGGAWKSYKAGGATTTAQAQARRAKPPPKTQQLHYCDVCRISCAGPQTYKEHLEGQKHKKKEAAAKLAGARAGGGAALRCELCDVTCTGGDAYAAHVRGIKHQKVVKLHTMLGKPIPSTEPTKLGVKKAVAGAARIAFVASGGLSTVPGEVTGTEGSPAEDAAGKESPEPEADVAPVGHDYIEELRADDGKPLSFNCKLCDCRFNDPNAKEMHMKGRRHRLQYKKKVQPDLEVRVKPSLQQRKLAEQKAARLVRDDWRGDWEWWPRRPDTGDDRAVAAKHAALYPPEAELRRLQRAVSSTERALKALSDAHLSQRARGNKGRQEDKDGRDNQLFSFAAEGEPGEGVRALKGVMRVGLLAKGLLLRGDKDVRLVVLCHDRPTITLLKRVAADLPKHLAALKQPTGEEVKYRVELQAAEGAVLVTDGVVNVRVSLTSAVMRDPAPEGGDDKDVLPRAKCLDALAALRHAKWFQARAAGLGSCVVVLRVLRDLRRRLPSWAPLSGWALELLAGAALAGGGALAAGEALRRVLEAVAAGVLLEGGPGLRDPCEKEPQDALAGLTAQAREDITASAQHALRQIAFRQIHKVLDMDPLPKVKHASGPWKFPRKRRRSNTDVEGEGKVVKTEGKVVKTEDKMDTSESDK